MTVFFVWKKLKLHNFWGKITSKNKMFSYKSTEIIENNEKKIADCAISKFCSNYNN